MRKFFETIFLIIAFYIGINTALYMIYPSAEDPAGDTESAYFGYFLLASLIGVIIYLLTKVIIKWVKAPASSDAIDDQLIGK